MDFFNEELREEMQLKLLKAMSDDEDYTIEDYTEEFSKSYLTTPNTMGFEQFPNDLKFSVNFVNESSNENPEYATLGASGFDLRANEDTILKAGEFKGISTGLFFELPVIVYFLTKLGLVGPNFLRKYRKYAILILLIIAAIVTPPDVVSQITVAIPMWLIYEASIWISVYVEKNKKKDEQIS
jgi:hypothetical protein